MKKTFLYKERDETERREFQKFIDAEPVKNLVFIDESGINHEGIKERAWSKRGVKVVGERSGAESHRRTSIIGGLCCGEVIAPFYFNGHTNTEVFCTWLERGLCPELHQGQVVIMDNAAFHKSPRIREIIEHAGCRLLYLPAYSPDLNPIEHYWAWLKAKLRNLYLSFGDFYDRLSFAINLKYGVRLN